MDPTAQIVRRGAQAVPEREQPKRPTRAKRPDQLSLFGGPDGGGHAGAPDDTGATRPGGAEAPRPGEGQGVTKPPTGGGGIEPARPDLPSATCLAAAF
jgi:hypothetical protein